MTQIPSSLHWQPALNDLGVALEVADVEQSIRVILKTPKGSDPLRPTFGSDCHLHIDKPVNIAVPYMVRSTVEAIRDWEPRCKLLRVVPRIVGAHIFMRIYWKLATGVRRETEVKL